MLTVPLGVVEVCQAGDEPHRAPVELDGAAEVAGRRRSTPSSPISPASSMIADDRRAGALGDGDGVAEVVAVAVGEQDRVGGDLVGRRGGLRVAGQERVDEHGRRRRLQREGGVAEEADVHQRSSPVSLDRMQLVGELEPDRDADQHAQAGLLGDQRAHRAAARSSGSSPTRPR